MNACYNMMSKNIYPYGKQFLVIKVFTYYIVTKKVKKTEKYIQLTCCCKNDEKTSVDKN